MIKAKVIGAGGYGGVGISELLLGHPEAELSLLVDVENVGVPISDIYPHLAGFIDMPIVDPASTEANQPVDVVFMSTPDRVGMKLAAAEIERGSKVVDYSGDFRFNSAEAYAAYAERIGLETDHTAPELLADAVYGLAELHRSEITDSTKVVGNPGCFAASCILGLAPAVKGGLIDLEGIVCDCKTGVSGAGKKPAAAFHYPARYDQMNAYKLSGHQHVCEVERELGLLAGEEMKVTFTSQVVPCCRGIMSTLYGRAAAPITEEALLAAYKEFYADDVFIKPYASTAVTGTHQVRGTNCCSLVVSVDDRTGMVRVVSYIDNLVKGQAGSALQNMNLLFDMNEAMGLDRPALYP